MKGRINGYQTLTQPPRAGEELGGAKAYATCQKYEATRELALAWIYTESESADGRRH